MHSPSGLEVNHQHSDLEHDRQAAVYPNQGPQLCDHYSYSRDEPDKASDSDMAAVLPLGPRVCGLSRKTFWILVAAAVIIITSAALGGGLGGGLSKNKIATASPQQTPTLSTSSTSTTYASASTTSSDANLIVTAQFGTVNGTPVTLYRDCPSTNNSLYSVQYSSTTYEFRKLCNMQLTNNVLKVNMVNQPASNLNDCINLCAAWNENNVTKGNADQACSSVCWRYGFTDNDDLPGQCFGFASTNASSGAFNIQSDALCDSAAWINQA
jgi:hypothetical protein